MKRQGEDIILGSEETEHLKSALKKLEEVENYLNLINRNKESLEYKYCYNYLNEIKNILKNLYDDINFNAYLMVKAFLKERHKIDNFTSAVGQQIKSGLDVDEKTVTGERIIGKIKTTVPDRENDLGASQKRSFFKNYKRLKKNNAKYKYFFVTELETFKVMKKRYLQGMIGVSLVLLPEALNQSEEYVIEVVQNDSS